MASPSPGTLLHLLQSDSPLRRPTLLQVTSILPVGLGPDLSPHRGFHLQLSDSSHSAFVSLPQEHDHLILTNQLQLGQLVHVHHLDPSSPLPVLRGISLLPRQRRPCVATPPLPEKRKKYRSLSPAGRGERASDRGFRSIPNSPVNVVLKRSELERTSAQVLKELKKVSVASVDDDSDGSEWETSKWSSSSCGIPRPRASRRSWDSGPIWEQKRNSRTPARRRTDVDSSNISTPTGARVEKKKGNKQQPDDRFCGGEPKEIPSDYKENDLLWDSLPTRLVKIGKEVAKQRDLAVTTAVEALQEASASESLLRCLNTYSEINSHKEDESTEELVDMFLNLHEDLTQARLIATSLARLSPLRSQNNGPMTSTSANEAVNITLDRRRRSAMWIRAAIESNLSPLPTTISTSVSSDDNVNDHTSCDVYRSGRLRANGEMWLKGKSSIMGDSLGSRLQEECNTWFLNYIEKFLDTMCASSDNQIASFLSHVKKFDHWLNSISPDENDLLKNNFKDYSLPEEEVEACGRVRKKIYGILIKYAERSAFIMENTNAPTEDLVT